jgi:D-alanyl-D-alanine dipeptidase
MPDLVYLDEYGLTGTNFYWHKYEAKGLTKEDVLNAGLTSDRVQVHKDLIEPLLAVQAVFRQKGYDLYIKEGYRSSALYDIVYQRRVEKFGAEDTNRQLNMVDKPHALGLSVDVALWDPATNTEVYLRKPEDGTDALFIDFYRHKEDAESQKCQELQDWVIQTMLDNGFRLGTKREYFHFDYRPHTPKNY